jgi:Phospholipase_D-nuclease N-terminal
MRDPLRYCDPMASKKRWSDLTRTQQGLIIASAAVELVFTVAALVDLARRPADQVRGPKSLWVLGCLVQPVGPVAYLALGRRPG